VTDEHVGSRRRRFDRHADADRDGGGHVDVDPRHLSSRRPRRRSLDRRLVVAIVARTRRWCWSDVDPSGPFCGDGSKDAGEDCDDGNTLDCDACPSDCKNAPADCTPIGTPPNTTRAPQKVTLHLTNGEALTSALFCLRYPAGTVGLPGTGAVPQRISGFQGQTSLNDFNNSAKIALLGRTALTEVSLTVSFDQCAGTTAPAPTAFKCAVVSASNAGATISRSSSSAVRLHPRREGGDESLEVGVRARRAGLVVVAHPSRARGAGAGRMSARDRA
jgi:cysteine-rich repeat protein